MPKKASRFLKPKIKVLIETNRAFGGGTYFPSPKWLKDNGHPEYWAKSVQFGDANAYLKARKKNPGVLLNFMADSWFDLKLKW